MKSKREIFIEHVMQTLALHFTKILCNQIGADFSSSAAVLKEIEKKTENYIYRLTCTKAGKVEKKRCSIRLLSGKGSKSLVFEVKYGQKFAVKIASSPMNLDKYMEEVSGEFMFQNLLRDENGRVVVITPCLQILGKILRTNPLSSEASIEAVENCYTKMFKDEAGLQNLLRCAVPIDENDLTKTEERYLFFMLLAENLMLADYYKALHSENDEALLREAASSFPFILDRDYDTFANYLDKAVKNCVDREEAEKVVDGLFQAFREFSLKVDDFAKKNNVPDYKRKEWFVMRLTGQSVEDSQFSEEIIAVFNAALLEVLEVSHGKDVKKFREILEKNISEKKFVANRQKIGAVITNLLLALVYLREKGVAARDLKPFNYLICGANFDGLVNYALFTLGFIDLETACNLNASREIGEPKTGVSKNYGNPTSLFPTILLRYLYYDIVRILLIQDWAATAIMIYELITGSSLFEDAAKEMNGIETRMSASSLTGKAEIIGQAKKEVQKWLDKARPEAEKKLKHHRLGQVDVKCPNEVLNLFLDELDEAHAGIERELEELISAQSFFPSDKQKKSLVDAPEELARKVLAKWLMQLGDKKDQNHILFVREVIRLKQLAEANRVEMAQIAQTKSQGGEIKFKANRILEFMVRIALDGISAYKK